MSWLFHCWPHKSTVYAQRVQEIEYNQGLFGSHRPAIYPEGDGVALIEDADGRVVQVIASNNIRRRIGELMDSQGTICVHGPKIYESQQNGRALFVRWKLTQDYKAEKKRLVEQTNPLWESLY